MKYYVLILWALQGSPAAWKPQNMYLVGNCPATQQVIGEKGAAYVTCAELIPPGIAK